MNPYYYSLIVGINPNWRTTVSTISTQLVVKGFVICSTAYIGLRCQKVTIKAIASVSRIASYVKCITPFKNKIAVKLECSLCEVLKTCWQILLRYNDYSKIMFYSFSTDLGERVIRVCLNSNCAISFSANLNAVVRSLIKIFPRHNFYTRNSTSTDRMYVMCCRQNDIGSD